MNDFGIMNIKNHFNHSSAQQMWMSLSKGDSVDGRRVKGVINIINPLWNKPVPFVSTPYRNSGPKIIGAWFPQFGTPYTIIRETVNEDNVTINIINPNLTVDDMIFAKESLKTNLRGTTVSEYDAASNGLNWGSTNINVI